jgi:hypothetical protein
MVLVVIEHEILLLCEVTGSQWDEYEDGRLEQTDGRFGHAYCFHHQGDRGIPEDGHVFYDND